MATTAGFLRDLLERLDRQRHVMKRRVVVDHDVELREHLADVPVEADGVLQARRKVVRHAEQNAIGARISSIILIFCTASRLLTDVTPMNSGTRFFTTATDSCASSAEFVRQKRVALAEAAGGRDDVGAVADHAVETVVQPATSTVEVAWMSAALSVAKAGIIAIRPPISLRLAWS